MPLLSRSGRHRARRFSAGLTPALASEITRAGGSREWFAAQLDPTRLADPEGDRVDGWFPALGRTPQQIFERQEAGKQGAWEVMYDLSRWTVARRVHSRRQVLEQMVDFWSNLLHVPLMDDEAWFYRVDYDRVIRRFALTTFEDLLRRTVVHPAMGLYLDNAVSTKDHPNENLGRELLELHSVGVDAGYTEADVKASSRMLTGYRVDVWWPEFRAGYRPGSHATGRIDVLGFSDPNADPDGRQATRAYLRYLAHHPATATRLARRLCVRFVSDSPSDELVAAVATAYQAHGTAIVPTLEALVDHPEFAASYGAKVRTPTEDYVATVRALGIRLERPTRDDSFVNAMYWQYSELGNPPYEWPAPDGYPEAGGAWTSAGRVLNGLVVHQDLAAGWWPTRDATFRAPGSWLPDLPATVADVVDRIGTRLLGETPGDAVRVGVATALGVPLDRKVTREDLWNGRIRLILAALLDSPTHLHR